MIKDYINTTNGKRVRIDIDVLPLSQVRLLKEVEPVKIPDVLKEIREEIKEVKRGRKPKIK